MFVGDQNNVKKKEHSSEKTFKGTLNKSFLNFLYLVNKVLFMFAGFCLSLHNTQQKLENENT